MNESKERRIYNKIYNMKRLKDYVSLILNDIHRLLHDLGYDDHMISSMLHKDRVDSAGQVCEKNVIEIIKKGNIREQLTAIYMFIEKNCFVIIKLIYEDKTRPKLSYINYSRLKYIKNSLKKLTGIKEDNKLYELLSDCSNTNACALCNVATVPEKGICLLSRIVGFPFGGISNLRAPRPKDPKDESLNYIVNISDIKPELSSREREFMKLPVNAVKVPWETGQMLWVINPNHFLVSIANKYNNSLISGPSGGTDIIIQACLLFTRFDIELSTLAGIAWCTNCPDHSAYECLISAMPYGLDYRLDIEDEIYVDKLITKHKDRVSIHSYYSLPLALPSFRSSSKVVSSVGGKAKKTNNKAIKNK
jgi:hypothetical protein